MMRREISKLACIVNESSENIGARRLHTIVEALLEDISFEGKQRKPKDIRISATYVRRKLEGIVQDKDLSRYIL
jgi:ATP-dependent HslUV protease ATP-binding subunit HslU